MKSARSDVWREGTKTIVSALIARCSLTRCRRPVVHVESKDGLRLNAAVSKTNSGAKDRCTHSASFSDAAVLRCALSETESIPDYSGCFPGVAKVSVRAADTGPPSKQLTSWRRRSVGSVWQTRLPVSHNVDRWRRSRGNSQQKPAAIGGNAPFGMGPGRGKESCGYTNA